MAGVAAVVVAAGRGMRAGGDMPKQFRPIGGESPLRRALSMFVEHREVGFVQPVIRPEDLDRYRSSAAGIDVLAPAFGGATRQASVRAGLEALAARKPDIVLIHDAARPFASAALVSRAIAAAKQSGAAIPALAVTDTIKTVDASGLVGADARPQHACGWCRRRKASPSTPCSTRTAARRARPRRFHRRRGARRMGRPQGQRVSPASPATSRSPRQDDFARAEAHVLGALGDVRTGTGIDVHAFGPGDHVTLGGVRIAHGQALTGHSDADVVLHALVDAILGALADGDIGAHFPPSDPQWRGASSDRFLTFAVERVKARGGRIAHLDLTIVCESAEDRPASRRHAREHRARSPASMPGASR